MAKAKCADCGSELISVEEQIVTKAGYIKDMTFWFCPVCDAKYIEECMKEEHD